MRYLLRHTMGAARRTLHILPQRRHTRDMSDVLPSGAAYSFSAQAYELSVRANSTSCHTA